MEGLQVLLMTLVNGLIHPTAIRSRLGRNFAVDATNRRIGGCFGYAGAGKAQTIAEMCTALGLVVASFSFSRASQSRNTEKCLISTIAYQLANFIPATRSYIESAQIDPAIFSRSLDTQIEALMVRPLENSCKCGRCETMAKAYHYSAPFFVYSRRLLVASSPTHSSCR
jgi:hypothetical protein